MGDRGKRPYEYDYPKTVSAWPLRVIAGRDGDPDREVRLLRLNWSKSYMSEEVQSQLRCIFDYLLTHRRAHGVPAHLTREHLVSLFRNTYEYWQRQHRLRRTAKGRSQTAQEKVRSKLLSRRRAKLSALTEALGIAELVRYADGTTLSRKGKANEAKVAARGLDMRADIEFAVQMAVHSPEEVEMESHNNSERMVVRPMFLEWRSLELLDGLKWMDDNRKCLRPHPVRRCLHVFRQSSNFRLPSTVRRWMVSSEYAAQHPDVCCNVSDNAGPFDVETGKFATIDSPTTWGCPIPVNRRPPTRSNGEYFGPGDAAGSDGEGDARDGEVDGGDSQDAETGGEDVEPWDGDDFDNDDFGEGGEGSGESEDLFDDYFGEGRVDASDDDDSDDDDSDDDDGGDDGDDDDDGGDDGYGAHAGLGYRGRAGSVEGVSVE
ncbi:unnamed protein product [Tilletia controversa]|uniref:Uncharacterized protein n=1 Tax=Tilletia controversa TaxID=13291 RepID=A0A8X7MMU7_9BASI|nr:hypothetical protein A4X06_0g7394 [Tilletia controversa]CAD6934788.1 unnamed protein product [Tilletia controversa]CAD6980668.1 unnamed protein product [Tilletia controversa]